MNQRFTIVDSSSIGPRAEPTPPSSYHPDDASPTSPLRYPAPDTPPATNMDADAQPIACMYIPNCDTGSTLRKAISHIFGRNKMCTRLIPQRIWVHYCRKHYQRSRYRNPKEYAKLQCDLVQKQIRAIREWSLANMKKGTAGVVQDWGLAVRKREQKRLDDLGGASRKRTASAAFDGDSDDEDSGRGNPVPATAVPQWLLNLCGKGYSTEAILDIFSRLHTEILNDVMPCFPDIEILPNIIIDQDEPKSPKAYTKRGSVGAHKRSQSLGVGMKSAYFSADRRMSQLSVWGQDSVGYAGSSQKRQRHDNMESMDGGIPSFQRSLGAERPIESGRRMQQLTHRPVFPNIDEHQAPEHYYGSSSQIYQQPLPAPTPQRLGGQSMAAHLETHNEQAYSARRPSHQRSHSDMSFTRGRSAYSPSQRTTHATIQEHNESLGQQYSGYRSEQTPTLHYPESRPMTQLPRPASYGHARHQSTPLTQQAYPPSPMHCMRESQPSSSNYGYGPSGNTRPPVPTVIESSQARAMYSSRR